ncbi:MAG: cell division protein ZapD [Gammaproteobacteria bacterium]|nr:MAG: cell division protein ZapD [Gammaproteobacteria bacterium]
MNIATDTNEICYEQPLNERMRTFLRYEELTRRFNFFAKQESSSDSHAALLTLIEILSLVSRGDLKQELLKELKRQIDTLEQLSNKPKLNTSKLTEILSIHKNTFDHLHTIRGQIGHHLKENDFLNSIRQRAVIPGGTCDFDLPEYHHWLSLSFNQRSKVLLEWIEPFEIVQQSVYQALRLIRESTQYVNKSAANGFYDQNLDPNSPNQLIRIAIAKKHNFFPECSAGKHRFSIRFLLQNDPNTTPKQTGVSIDFKLACCTF